MIKLNFRTLKAEEIECRIGTVKKDNSGCSLLLYKDARVDMRLLDETVGPFNWKRSHRIIDGNLYCTLSVYDADKREWIDKEDVGTESNTEKEKGQASDSFKRAGFNWGIGRELYTAPFIWITKDKMDSSGRYSVSKIEYDETRHIAALIIINSKGAEVYSYTKTAPKPSATAPKTTTPKDFKQDVTQFTDIFNKAKACKSLEELTALSNTLRGNNQWNEEIRTIFNKIAKENKWTAK